MTETIVRPPTHSGRRLLNARVGRAIAVSIPLVIALVLWEVGVRHLNSLYVPGPVDTLTAAVLGLGAPETWNALALSNIALVIGYVGSVLVGVPLGLLMGRAKRFGRILDVWLDSLLTIPMVTIIPLIIIALGLELSARVFVIIVFAVPYLAVNCRAGVREVPSDLLDMGRTFGASERQLWFRVVIPAASPAIWAGLRLAIGRCFTAMVFTELVMVSVGIGRLMQVHRAGLDNASLYAVVIYVVAEALLLLWVARRIEIRLTTATRRDRR